MYDSLHTGDRCGQVKCLGKTMADVTPGDDVVLHRLATPEELAAIGEPPSPGEGASEEEFDAWADHPYIRGYYNGEPRLEDAWAVPMADGSFAVFSNGRFDGFSSDGTQPGVVVVDNVGRDVAPGTASVRTGTVGPSGDCQVCAAVREAAALANELDGGAEG